MTRNRFDETWHRLLEWTRGQAQSERLAGQILLEEGFIDFDPSHPLGGRDGGKDAIAKKEGTTYSMAVHFPRGQKDFKEIKEKFLADLSGAKSNSVKGIAFVTNQELTLGEREEIRSLAAPLRVELYHLERVTAILDKPAMASVREQFLDIEANGAPEFQLGGLGGAAPGAGGGGGGAIGPSARGGTGGPGGKIINLGDIELDIPFGAGGGGAGAVGEDAVGGDGGGGGEMVSFSLKDLSKVHHLDLQVGKAGVGGPAEDTIVNICDKDGQILRSVVAKGGSPGAAPHVPPPSRMPTDEDVNAGLKVTGVIAGEFIRFRDGVWTVVNGFWDWVGQATNPFRLSLPLLIEFDTGEVEPGSVLKLRIAVRSPNNFQVHEQELLLTVNAGTIRKTRSLASLEFAGSQAGVWRVEVMAARQVIGEWRFEIRLPETIAETANQS